jgi:DNA-3-methyladenine glycosylase I
MAGVLIGLWHLDPPGLTQGEMADSRRIVGKGPRMERCGWAGTDPLYHAYHDTEWGRPVTDGRALFAALVLESFQSGLSWITILRKREGFHRVFDGLDPDALAAWGAVDIARALTDPGIIRHRGKIAATVTNARAWLALGGAQSFARLVWAHVGHRPLAHARARLADVPGQTAESTALARELKQKGFAFCGPTTVYAFMQATGLVNDHVVTCPCHAEVAALHHRFAPA